MMGSVNVLQRGYRIALQYEERRIGGKLGRIDQQNART